MEFVAVSHASLRNLKDFCGEPVQWLLGAHKYGISALLRVQVCRALQVLMGHPLFFSDLLGHPLDYWASQIPVLLWASMVGPLSRCSRCGTSRAPNPLEAFSQRVQNSRSEAQLVMEYQTSELALHFLDPFRLGMTAIYTARYLSFFRSCRPKKRPSFQRI